MKTTIVESISSLYFLNPFSLGSQGQVALRSSTETSVKNLVILDSIAETSKKKDYEKGKFYAWQGKRDSNPQPMVLETTTLPIELLPSVRQSPATNGGGGFLDGMAVARKRNCSPLRAEKQGATRAPCFPGESSGMNRAD